jgi:hypothetical protein
MSALPSHHDSLPESGHRTGVFSNGAARAGRELVWLAIAVAFCVLEVVVFVTDLPVSKIFGRRDLQRASGRGL